MLLLFMKSKYLQFSILSIAILLACKSDLHNKSSVLYEANQVVNKNINVEVNEQSTNDRAIWQKPNLVIEKLGDISHATVADIGAGTGYFSFRFAQKAKKVIAIDIEKDALAYIDSVKNTIDKDIASKVITRISKPDDAMLNTAEVDIIVIINTIGYIEDIPEYLSKLKKSLRNGGKIMIIDYKMKRLPINAPAKELRVYLDKLEDMLTEAGFELTDSDDTSLDYQYIIQASMLEN